MNTNFKKLTKLMLPFGLLLVAGVSLAERLTGTALPDAAKGFLIGFGIGLMIVALIMQKFGKRGSGVGGQRSEVADRS